MQFENCYFPDGLITEIVESDSKTTGSSISADNTFQYDLRNRLTRERRVNITGSAYDVVTYDFAYTYDDGGNRLTKIERDADSGDILRTTSYTYDITDSGDGGQHNNRLLYWETTEEGKQDPEIEVFYRYGPDGNVSIHARRLAGANVDAVWYFYYDSSDHLWMVVEGNGDYDEETGETENFVLTGAAEYRYDGARQRYLVMPRDPETLEPMNPKDDGRWRDYAGDGIYLDYKADDIQGGTVNDVRQYLAGVGFNDRNESEMPAHFANDHLGSNRWMLSNNDPPPLVGRKVFTAFGEERRDESTLGSRYGFCGAHGYEAAAKEGDPLNDLGWLHLGHRYYDPYSGRFMQRDPIGINAGPNVYVYCSNNPVSAIDPDGLTIIVFHWRGPGVGHTAAYSTETGRYLSFVPISASIFNPCSPSFKSRTYTDDYTTYGMPDEYWTFDGLDESKFGPIADKYDGFLWCPGTNCIDSVLEALVACGAPKGKKPLLGWLPPNGRKELDRLGKRLFRR